MLTPYICNNYENIEELLVELIKNSREVDYQLSLSIAESLLRAGHLTNGEFIATRTLLLEKYRPPIGILLAEVG